MTEELLSKLIQTDLALAILFMFLIMLKAEHAAEGFLFKSFLVMVVFCTLALPVLFILYIWA